MKSYDIFDKKYAKLLNSDYQTNVPTIIYCEGLQHG